MTMMTCKLYRSRVKTKEETRKTAHPPLLPDPPSLAHSDQDQRERMEADDVPQIKGVFIISLPPPDNPSLGKTITAFTLTNTDTDFSLQQNQTHQEFNLPVQSPRPPLPPPPPPPPPLQPPQSRFPLSRFFLGIPRKTLGFLCISVFALVIYRSLFSRNILKELKNPNNDKDDDDHGPKSFIFPLYHKFDIREIPQRDLESTFKRLVYKENSMVDASIHDDVNVNVPHKTNKLVLNAAARDSSSIFPVRGNVYPDGLYFTYVLVGSPPRPYYLDIDTGSDLTWIQCDAPCTSCAKGANALYKLSKVSLVLAKDSLCMEVQRNLKPGYCDTCQQCDYEIEYADHSSSLGVLARDELHLMKSNGSLSKTNFIFGCAYDQQGLLLNTLSKTDGILGLSSAKVSLPSQLASEGIIKNLVGHCLPTDVGGGGYMFLGDDFVPDRGMAWVPMLGSPSTYFYQTQAVRLSYGSSPLSIGGQDSRLGQIVFDSGSSYTYFTREAYSELASSLKEVSGAGLTQDTSDSTLPLCWQAKFPIRSVADVKQFFKTITLQFGSKWLIIFTKFRIPPEGYLMISKKGNVCLGILDGSNVYDGSTIILGDISLRGQLVVYDNVNKKIGWAASDCAKAKSFNSLPFFNG